MNKTKHNLHKILNNKIKRIVRINFGFSHSFTGLMIFAQIFQYLIMKN